MCQTCDWEIYKDDIEMALDDVSDPTFLESVLEQITEREHITSGQAVAVDRWLDNV